MAYLPAYDIFNARLDRADVTSNILFQRRDQASMPYLSNFISSSAGAYGHSFNWAGLGDIVGSIGRVISPRIGQLPKTIPDATGGVGDVSTIPQDVPPPAPSGITTAGKVAVGVGTAIAGAVGLGMHVGGIGAGRAARYAAPGTRGYHMIKKGPHAGMWTRNRRMRVTNVRAIRRGLRRLHGFEKICRRVLRFTSPRGARGRPVFRRRRRRC